ncbi:hypothetical protein C0993_000640, partial [Termitomyces sp. T159_Od127]
MRHDPIEREKHDRDDARRDWPRDVHVNVTTGAVYPGIRHSRRGESADGNSVVRLGESTDGAGEDIPVKRIQMGFMNIKNVIAVK